MGRGRGGGEVDALGSQTSRASARSNASWIFCAPCDAHPLPAGRSPAATPLPRAAHGLKRLVAAAVRRVRTYMSRRDQRHVCMWFICAHGWWDGLICQQIAPGPRVPWIVLARDEERIASTGMARTRRGHGEDTVMNTATKTVFRREEPRQRITAHHVGVVDVDAVYTERLDWQSNGSTFRSDEYPRQSLSTVYGPHRRGANCCSMQLHSFLARQPGLYAQRCSYL